MTIVRKEHLNKSLKELREYYENLRAAVEGQRPEDYLAFQYGFEDCEQFAREFTDIDLLDIETKIEHFKVAVASLKQLKKLERKPRHRG